MWVWRETMISSSSRSAPAGKVVREELPSRRTYSPGSSTKAPSRSRKLARPARSKESSTSWLSPGARVSVLAKAARDWYSLSSSPPGAETYSWTTSLPE